MGDRRRILLVDDELSIRKVIGKRLEVEGFEVFLAQDGQEAIEMARTHHPDLIILDLMLPKLSGFDVCAALKKDGGANTVPIITMFTGKGQDEDEARCKKLGAAAYITKSQGAVALLAQIRSLLGEQDASSTGPLDNA